MGGGAALREHGGFFRLHGGAEDAGEGFLQAAARADKGGPRTHTGKEGGRRHAIGAAVVHDLKAGGFVMDARALGIAELVGSERAGNGGEEFVRLGKSALHALFGRREHEFGPQRLEQGAAFHAGRGRHGEHEAQAFLGADHGKADAEIAAGGFHHGSAGSESPGGEGGFDVAACRPVLNRAARVAGFVLHPDAGGEFGGKGVEQDEGRVPYGVEDIHADLTFRWPGRCRPCRLPRRSRRHRQRRNHWKRCRLW